MFKVWQCAHWMYRQQLKYSILAVEWLCSLFKWIIPEAFVLHDYSAPYQIVQLHRTLCTMILLDGYINALLVYDEGSWMLA